MLSQFIAWSRTRLRRTVALSAVGVLVLGIVLVRAFQGPVVAPIEEGALREYAAAYRWDQGGFVYLQLWEEFTGFGKPRQLTAFDEAGDVRTLYPTGPDTFFTGPSVALATSVESRIRFERDAAGRISGFSAERSGVVRKAQRFDSEQRHDVRFANGNIQLSGTLIAPVTAGRHPALILVHGSGAEDRNYPLPFARFLVRRGIAVLGYDKRGVGESTGDWTTATFDELAGDVVAAFEYLKTRSDVDPAQIGLIGVSQAGWVMPLAAVRAPGIAFLISVSGAGVPAAETTIDQAQNEMTAAGMRPAMVTSIVDLMKLQYAYAATGDGWDVYAAARARLAARMGQPPDTFPATADHPYWQVIRRSYLYDPAPTLRQLRTPTLALFGGLDNNIVAEKNRAAWEAALSASPHPDYTLVVLPKANHFQWEAIAGSNAEMPSLKRFIPEYRSTIEAWLTRRIRGFQRD